MGARVALTLVGARVALTLVYGDRLVLAADSGRLPANARLGELQTPVISILFRLDYSVTLLHGGSRNEETRSITNRVFNVEQTEETQEHR